jgi:hypothetical protein
MKRKRCINVKNSQTEEKDFKKRKHWMYDDMNPKITSTPEILQARLRPQKKKNYGSDSVNSVNEPDLRSELDDKFFSHQTQKSPRIAIQLFTSEEMISHMNTIKLKKTSDSNVKPQNGIDFLKFLQKYFRISKRLEEFDKEINTRSELKTLSKISENHYIDHYDVPENMMIDDFGKLLETDYDFNMTKEYV